MKLSPIKKDIMALDYVEKYNLQTNYKEYRRVIIKLLKSYGIKRIDGGSYSDVYSAKDLKYVIKIIKHPGSGKYATRYSKMYLKPTYVSKNCCLAIQKKVPILRDIIDDLYDKYEDAHDSNLGLSGGKILIIDLDKNFETH
jgi:hypothetical protein